VPTSRDKQQPNRIVLYRLLDTGTRPDFNARVKERNARRNLVTAQDSASAQVTGTPPPGPAPLATEGREGPHSKHPDMAAAFAALAKARKEMRAEHETDRESLRQLHASETQAHRQLAQQHDKATRQAAIAAVGQQFAGKWDAVWKLPEAEQRAAAAALKVKQAAAFKAMGDRMMAIALAEKESKWQAMRAAQSQARRDLKDDHRAEETALAREGLTIARKMSGQSAQITLMRQRAAWLVTHAGWSARPTTQRTAPSAAVVVRRVEAMKKHDREGGRER
jgi:hypothetical protein